MNRILLAGMTAFFAVVGVALMSDETQAQAWYGGYRYSAAYPSYSYYGRPGRAYPVRRLLSPRWRTAYRRYGYAGSPGYYGSRGVYGWGGYYGSRGVYGWRGYYSWPRSNGYYYSSYDTPGSTSWSTGYRGVQVVEYPVTVIGDSVVVSSPAVAPASDATIHVRVAPDVSVFVNGASTTSSGRQRSFVSKGLEVGKRYRYELRAEAVRDGRTVSQTKVVTMEAGQNARVEFDLAAPRVAAASAP